MSNTVTLAQDGLYDLSEPILPFLDRLSFSRLSVRVHSSDEYRGTWVMGVGEDGLDHPAPLLQTPLVLEPDAAVAALGYTLG